jgi:hypothetical protein
MSGIADWFIGVIQSIIDGLGQALTWLVNALPESPFSALSNLSSNYMKWLNWLVPINQMVTILEAWTAAIIVYYLLVVILRWVKAIQ